MYPQENVLLENRGLVGVNVVALNCCLFNESQYTVSSKIIRALEIIRVKNSYPMQFYE